MELLQSAHIVLNHILLLVPYSPQESGHQGWDLLESRNSSETMLTLPQDKEPFLGLLFVQHIKGHFILGARGGET